MCRVFVNGRWSAAEQARISVFDRGFLFGDSLYEVIPVFRGKPFYAQRHIQRLQRGLAAIGLDEPLVDYDWSGLISDTIRENGGGDPDCDLMLYLQVSRGLSFPRDHRFPSDPQPTIVAWATPLEHSLMQLDELLTATAVSMPDTRWARCDIKTTALLANVLSRQQAVAQEAAEAVLLRDGYAREGAASNLFAVIGGECYTAPADQQILAGITRSVVLDLCRDHGLVVHEQALTLAQLLAADELFLTSSTKEIVPLRRLDERAYAAPGPVTRELVVRYLELKQRFISHPAPPYR